MMKLKWLGRPCFRVECEGYSLVLDPYEPGSVPGRMRHDPPCRKTLGVSVSPAGSGAVCHMARAYPWTPSFRPPQAGWVNKN